jgi:superfamily I DNA/RNA helicase
MKKEMKKMPEMKNEYRVFGPPGTGKTSYLARQIEHARKQHGAENIFVTSFTRAAALEIASRDRVALPKASVGTLHAHCYRNLDYPELAEKHTAEFNSEYPDFAITNEVDIDDPFAVQPSVAPAAKSYQEMQRLRSMMIPQEMWPTDVRLLHKTWEEWKRGNNMYDFTDLLEINLRDIPFAPQRPVVGFIDEAQDMTPLQFAIIRKWGQDMETFVLTGDEEQCQPAGEQVLTTKGYKDIKDINPHQDRLLSYSKCDAMVFGHRNGGYSFEKAVRKYTGNMFTVETKDKKTRCTDSHKWLVKWEPESMEKLCVYLMRRKFDFRVGWCKLIKSDKGFHLGARTRLEKADATWVLKILDTREEASIWESYISAQWGITTATFRPVKNSHYSEENLETLYSMLRGKDDGLEQLRRAINLLTYFNLDITKPFWSPKIAQGQQGGKSIMMVYACNLIPEIMSIPVLKENSMSKVKWVTIENIVKEKVKSVPVYSLNVKKYHTYITNDMVTHNCLYSFVGATPESLLDPPLPEERIIILGQSYRVPRAVLEWARNIISKVERRQPKEYRPRKENGEEVAGKVRLSQATAMEPSMLMMEIEKDLERGKKIMVLASCAYMLVPLIKSLRAEGIPYHNPYRRKQGAWNPLHASRGVSSAERLAAFMRFSQEVWGDMASPRWTTDDLAKWIPVIKSEVLRYGIKTKIKKAPSNHTFTISDIFEDEAGAVMVFENEDRKLQWFEDNLTETGKRKMEYPLKILRKDKSNINRTPQLITGTIHSVKGGEADIVYVLPDLARPQVMAWTGNRQEQDSLRRLYYVAGTRSREELVLCTPSYGVHGFPLMEGLK